MKIEPKKQLRILLLFLAGAGVLTLLGAPRLQYFRFTNRALVNDSWGRGSIQLPIARLDFNGDGKPEQIELRGGALTLVSGEQRLYTSEAGWRVNQAEFADLNGDGRAELILLVWRPFEPWPVDRLLPTGGRIAGFHDADGQSCHLILLGWSQGGVREVWAGSALAEPVLTFVAGDLNGDGRLELVTLDGDYANPLARAGKTVKIWEWNGFGFSRLEQISVRARHINITNNADGSPGLLVAN